jgi:hypothetical protein
LLIIFNTTHQETIAAGTSMCFQQETDTMDVEQLKLLKGRFDSKTLVAGKRGRAVA